MRFQNSEEENKMKEKLILLISEKLLDAGIELSKHSAGCFPLIYFNLPGHNPVEIVDRLFSDAEKISKTH